MGLYDINLTFGIEADSLESAITKLRSSIGKKPCFEYVTLGFCEEIGFEESGEMYSVPLDIPETVDLDWSDDND